MFHGVDEFRLRDVLHHLVVLVVVLVHFLDGLDSFLLVGGVFLSAVWRVEIALSMTVCHRANLMPPLCSFGEQNGNGGVLDGGGFGTVSEVAALLLIALSAAWATVDAAGRTTCNFVPKVLARARALMVSGFGNPRGARW